ncbi:winged helix DNA-binding domain-containing protein [Myxococcaceae bacterium GXIMD 01537]
MRRVKLGIPEAIEHLVGLQAQAPNPPYVGLWTRLEGFQLEALSQLMRERGVVRSAMMRGTLHLVTARDFLQWRPVLQAVLERMFKSAYRRHLDGLDAHAVAAAGVALLERQPLTGSELAERLGARWPGRESKALSNCVRNLESLIHVPPAGTWNSTKAPTLAPAARWLGRALEPVSPPDALVWRYLAAFGPATVKDVQAWSGLMGVRAVLERMRPRLRTFRDANGQELFDVPDAPLPEPDLDVAPRFVPDFDNLLLSHAERSRIISEEDRAKVFTVNGIVRPTILVDGFVRGLWRIEEEAESATLRIQPFAKLSKQVRAALIEEGGRLLAFAAREARSHDVRFDPVS